MRNAKWIAAAVGAVVLLVGCGSTPGADSGEPVSTSGERLAFNDADVMFAQMMIPHHEQAIEMSDIALDPTVGAGDAVRDLADRIKGAQDPEIQAMKGFLGSWGASTEMDPSMDHSDMMSGMVSAEEMTRLGTLRGAEFDRAWMAAMIAHHEGAIDMAKYVLNSGQNGEVKTLANSIIAGQSAEITEMKSLLK